MIRSLMQTLLPLPVEPAIRRCGIFPRSAVITLPEIPLPNASVSAFDLIPYMFYPFLLLISVLVFIAISPRKKKDSDL